MKCKAVQEQIAAYALGDLDIEARGALEGHLQSCGACRSAAERSRTALRPLETLPSVETAQGRRDRVVSAMAREHAKRVEGILLRPRRRLWIPLAAAAALLVAGLGIGTALLFRPAPTALRLHAVSVRGKARVYREGTWDALRAGTRLGPGDRVRTEGRAVVRFEVWSREERRGLLYLNENSILAIGSGRGVDLEQGEVYVDLPASSLRIRTMDNELVDVRSGSCVVGVREAVSLVMGVSVTKPARVDGADLVFENRPFHEVAARVSGIAGIRIRPGSRAVADQRVWFYGRSSRGKELFGEFEQAMRGQRITLEIDGAQRVARIAYPIEKRERVRRLYARVTQGSASVSSAQGEVRLGPGEETYLGPGAAPGKTSAGSTPVPWIREGYYERRPIKRVAIPGTFLLRRVGLDRRGRPVWECRIEGGEVWATLEGRSVVITTEDVTWTGRGDLQVPVRIKFE